MMFPQALLSGILAVCRCAASHRGDSRSASPGRRLRCIALALMMSTGAAPSDARTFPKLAPLLTARASLPTGHSQVVVMAKDQASLNAVAFLIRELGGTVRRRLPITNGQAATVPN